MRRKMLIMRTPSKTWHLWLAVDLSWVRNCGIMMILGQYNVIQSEPLPWCYQQHCHHYYHWHYHLHHSLWSDYLCDHDNYWLTCNAAPTLANVTNQAASKLLVTTHNYILHRKTTKNLTLVQVSECSLWRWH